MNKPIDQHSGNKYLRWIHPALKETDADREIRVDVYCVLEAFQVTCPAVQHAVKKLLCAGLRDKGSRLKDLQEAIDAIYRAVELAKNRGDDKVTSPVLQDQHYKDHED